LGQKRNISLPAWIEEVGINKVASLLCLERSTVRQWRTGLFIPKSLHMYEIVKLSKGRVSYSAIIEPWAARQPKEA
jgi:hypothetical protein